MQEKGHVFQHQQLGGGGESLGLGGGGRLLQQDSHLHCHPGHAHPQGRSRESGTNSQDDMNHSPWIMYIKYNLEMKNSVVFIL